MVFSYCSIMGARSLALTFAVAALWRVGAEPQTHSSPATHLNSTAPSAVSGEDGRTQNATDATVGSRISSLMTHLPTLKNAVVVVCALTAVLMVCLVVRVVR